MKFLFKPVTSFEDVTRDLEQLEGATSPVWTPLAYGTNYADAAGSEQGAGLWKDGNGFVHIRGAVKKTVAWVANETMFTLPVGTRPAATERFTCPAFDHTAGAFVAVAAIGASGAVFMQNWTPTIGAPAALDFLWLGHIIFQQAK